MTNYRKKLIEVALPLEAINRESAREKSIRHGHPSTLHLWWARRPLAACRAVLFASLVDDPSAHPERFPTEQAQEAERQRLFRIIEQLVKWENTTNEKVLQAARDEIMKATDGNPPPVLDPFCGGGSIPLEAQRLGLEAHASDLNPVAVLVTKALIEIPPKFAGWPPVNPGARSQWRGVRSEGGGDALSGVDRGAEGDAGGAGGVSAGAAAAARGGHDAPQPSPRLTPHSSLLFPRSYTGAQGLADDVRYYGKWMRDEAEKRIGHLYPKVKLPPEQGGGEATVIAWLWARTVRCPNPACGAEMPLVRSFWLSTKPGKQAWVEPLVDSTAKSVRFDVQTGQGLARGGTVGRQGATCLLCDASVPLDHVRAEGQAGRMGARLMAVAIEGRSNRVYLPPTDAHEMVAKAAKPTEAPDTDLPNQALGFRVQNYGMTKHRDLFTSRQLVALTTFCDLVGEARERVHADALAAGLADDGVGINDGGAGATAYADAMATYLAFAVSRVAESGCSLSRWQSTGDFVAGAFSRQALPMVWDFAEVNPFSGSTRNFIDAVGWVAEVVASLPAPRPGSVIQHDAAAATQARVSAPPIFSTDPPYYDNVPYAGLSDFFYVWLRRSLPAIYPDLFGTLLTPKTPELVADPFRHGGRSAAKRFFEAGLGKAFAHMRAAQHPDYPLTLFYAFKQAEAEEEGSEGKDGSRGIAHVSSTGWETMLEALVQAGFVITGTWPSRTERSGRLREMGSNALASSIVLVCRPRPDTAPLTSRREFLAELKRELPPALKMLQRESIAPVDLAQAAIGPGMAVFSRYHRVLEADGRVMPVRTALALINQTLDEILAEQEGEFDAETRWAVAWFEQLGMNDGLFGVAETLSKAKNTAVNALVEAGLVEAKSGRVRLLRRDELPADWDPTRDWRVTIWEVAQHLIHALEQGGEEPAARLLARVGGLGEAARDLAYRLYTICERKKWAQDALGYNSLVVAWPEISRLALQGPGSDQQALL